MRKYTVVLKEKISIHTGDSRGGYSKVIPSGFIGSLRWHANWLFYSKGWLPCVFNGRDGGCSDPNSLCPVCNIFGCTARSSSYSLMIEQKKQEDENSLREITLKILTKVDDQKTEKLMSELHYIIKYIQRYAALGAGTAQGYGIFEIIESDLPNMELNEPSELIRKNCYFGSEVVVTGEANPFRGGTIATWPKTSKPIREQLRQIMQNDKKARHWFFGTSGGNWEIDGNPEGNGPKASVVKVSNFWKEDDSWRMRIWGYLKEEQRETLSTVIDEICSTEKIKEILLSIFNIPEDRIEVTQNQPHLDNLRGEL